MRESEEQAEAIRKQVIRLLAISNPDESIVGACNNRMQMFVTTDGNLQEAEAREKKLQQKLTIALGALADIAFSEDVTLAFARNKARRIYTDLVVKEGERVQPYQTVDGEACDGNGRIIDKEGERS